jgi:hypothetical protein
MDLADPVNNFDYAWLPIQDLANGQFNPSPRVNRAYFFKILQEDGLDYGAGFSLRLPDVPDPDSLPLDGLFGNRENVFRQNIVGHFPLNGQTGGQLVGHALHQPDLHGSEKAEIETFTGFFWGIRKKRSEAYLNF